MRFVRRPLERTIKLGRVVDVEGAARTWRVFGLMHHSSNLPRFGSSTSAA